MPDSSVTPGGFRWVEQGPVVSRGSGTDGSPGRWRWWLTAVAVVVVVAVAVGGVLVWRFWRHSPLVAEPLIGTPKSMLVSFALDRQPVPGWRTTTADIGLPRGAGLTGLFASDGEKAYFQADDCGGDCGHPVTGYVFGLNVRTGAKLFPPVPLPGLTLSDQCHGNGPGLAVCLGLDDNGASHAWTVDLDRGARIYSGPTEVKFTDATEIGEKFGTVRLVNGVGGKGIYGIGAHGERTWFVPGHGTAVVAGQLQVNDMPSLSLAAQSEDEGKPDRVFSVIDGRDLTPTTDKGHLDEARVFQDGFAYQYTSGAGGGVLMYDGSGRLVSSDGADRYYLQDSAALPVLLDRKNMRFLVFSIQGSLLVNIPAPDSVANFKTIGTTLFVQKPADLRNIEEQNPWQQWDLLTGKSAGPACKIDFDGTSYVGSDGQVIITKGEHIHQTIAVDRSTCKTIWQFPDRTDVWKVGNSLLRSDFPYDAITSLHAPD